MQVIDCDGINSFLILASKLLLKKGIERRIGEYICFEFPQPLCFRMCNPNARWVILPERRWNIFLAYAESLWIASGRNDLSMISCYLQNMVKFSDDGRTLRGGYGPRIRAYDNSTSDYQINALAPTVTSGNSQAIDQIRFVVECFKEDINTRKAVIQIGDPVKDCFDLTGAKKNTKDFPCTRTLHFMKNSCDNRLNLIVHMRSNDLLWGASGVDIFNFTFMHEYMANMLGLEMGCYYHIVDNFHFYDRYRTKIKAISKAILKKEPYFKYPFRVRSLSDFNRKVTSLADWEERIRMGLTKDIAHFHDSFFDDWAAVLYRFHFKKKCNFKNPILNRILDAEEAHFE
jgi:thymidylate synthase